jgi:hypothetical protein
MVDDAGRDGWAIRREEQRWHPENRDDLSVIRPIP